MKEMVKDSESGVDEDFGWKLSEKSSMRSSGKRLTEREEEGKVCLCVRIIRKVVRRR